MDQAGRAVIKANEAQAKAQRAQSASILKTTEFLKITAPFSGGTPLDSPELRDSLLGSRVGGGPGPLKVVAAEVPGDVDRFADEV